jgi:hypothetical protein
VLERCVDNNVTNEIGKLFPFKDNIKEKHAQSLVVYGLTCETCKQTYIGKTGRILAHKIKEHQNPKRDSAIRTHRLYVHYYQHTSIDYLYAHISHSALIRE